MVADKKENTKETVANKKEEKADKAACAEKIANEGKEANKKMLPAIEGVRKSTAGSRKSTRSGTKSKSKRRRKRAKLPEGFDQWPEEDQQYYQDVAAILRNAKATRRQCRFRRERIGAWSHIKFKFKRDLYHGMQIEAYKKNMKEYKPLDAGQSVDLDI